MPDIISHNQLIQAENGVYRMPGQEMENFGYSDGAESEQYLHQVLSAAGDLSCRSPELQQKIIDWPSEYHLSSDRCNLLRPYNLDRVNTVLELGSGCSAISRYLGEQGKQVDAVEGSPIRAGLGRIRCRDLDNVRIVNANYNELTFPQQHYDMVLFVGVIEYARKFHPEAESDEAAAKEILSRALTMLKPDGVVLVAIENRLGFKYILGAHEDHYARRYVGINGYLDSAGIATYSHTEWQSLASQSGFNHYRFSYPFPDYKIPTVVLSDQYVQQNRFASNHLEGMISRDYYSPIKRSATESISWQAASQGGFLAETANSFCVLMSNQSQSLEQIQDFDFCHGPGKSRKNCYAVTTRKPANQNLVQKIPVDTAQGPISVVDQQLEDQAFIQGNLLSGQWLRTLLIYVRREEFEQCLKEYYGFLDQVEQRGELNIDLLPINILVDSEGRWQVFDQEWLVEWKLSKEYLLFRALLTFIVTNWVYLKDFLGWLELQTVRDFVEYGFHANMIHLSENLSEFIEMENRFQKTIARDEQAQEVEQLLATVFDFSEGKDQIYTRLYWGTEAQEFEQSNSVEVSVVPLPEPQQVYFDFSPNSEISALRIDPFDIRKTSDTGFFRISNIALYEVQDEQQHLLWQLEGAKSIAEHCQADSAVFNDSVDHPGWMATTDFPKLVVALPLSAATRAGAAYRVAITLHIVHSLEYALAYKHYLVSINQTAKIEDRANKNFIAMKVVQQGLQDKVGFLQQDVASQQSEIDAIKASTAFRLGSRIMSTLARIPGLGKRTGK